MLPYQSDSVRTRPPVVTLCLVAINVFVFFRMILHGNHEYIVWQYGFIPERFAVLNLVMSLFIHGDLFHLLFNMWFLWLFGANLEERLGPVLFLFFYIMGGVIAFYVHALTANEVARHYPCIGASGAISAVMGGYMTFFPNAKLRMFTFIYYRAVKFNMSAHAFLVFWFLWQILQGSGGNASSIAYWAHISGFLFGVYGAFVLKYYIVNQDKE